MYSTNAKSSNFKAHHKIVLLLQNGNTIILCGGAVGNESFLLKGNYLPQDLV